MPATYDDPTPADFKVRFPIFTDESTSRIQMFLDEAHGSVDKSWLIQDYRPAIMYLAAHLLATDNSGEDETVEVGGAGQGRVASESFGGGMSVSYTNGAASTPGSLSSNDQYGTTVYGRRFLALLLRNRRGPVVV